MGVACHSVYAKERDLTPRRYFGRRTASSWKNDFDQLAFKGNPLIEEVLFFHRQSRTVILDDLIQIHPTISGKPFRNALLKLEGVVSPYGGVGLDIRLSFIRRDLARQSLEKLLSWDFDKLIIAHGTCIKTNAKAFVERGISMADVRRQQDEGAREHFCSLLVPSTWRRRAAC